MASNTVAEVNAGSCSSSDRRAARHPRVTNTFPSSSVRARTAEWPMDSQPFRASPE